jgi:hypothetical protein
MKGTEYFMTLYTNLVITEDYNVTVNREELIVTTEYLTLWKRCRVNRCFYNRVLLYISVLVVFNLRWSNV